jgi:hypothetical protein
MHDAPHRAGLGDRVLAHERPLLFRQGLGQHALLQRDLTVDHLVGAQPHMAQAARTERPDHAVAPGNELSRGC